MLGIITTKSITKFNILVNNKIYFNPEFNKTLFINTIDC